MRLRQEVVNVVLAQLLEQRGLAAVPEQIIRAALHDQRAMPDVIIDFQGLRLAIEAEFASTDNAEEQAVKKAAERVEQGVAHIGVAVIYPVGMESQQFASLADELSRAELHFAIVTEVPEPPPVMRGRIDDLAEALRSTYDQLIQEEAVGRAVAVLEAGIERFVESLQGQPAASERFAAVLGTGGEGASLSNRQRTAVTRISALVLVNAMIFEEVLAAHEPNVKPLIQFRGQPDIVSELADHWTFILNDINYYPIFNVARDLLTCLAADADVIAAIEQLVSDALRIVGWRAALRHDLMGRVYHRLLEEAKYLGAYYTSIPAATLLVKLALDSDRWPVDWSDASGLTEFQVVDLACGTGTLLMAAADAIVDNHVRACVEQQRPPALAAVHPTLIAESLWGFDVLPSALHLTASTLSLRVPEIPVNATHLYNLRLGGPNQELGSLEFLSTPTISSIRSLFTTVPERVRGDRVQEEEVHLPLFNLCVMNPPFTRNVGGNLLFGNLPDAERKPMQERLKRLVRRMKEPASITAGLGSVFTALASRHLSAGGRLALVLPRAVLSGVAWGKTRDLLASNYDIEYLIVSHEPDHWNFSENTNLSEALVVARKRASGNEETDSTVCVNLWRNPSNSIESLAIANQLTRGDPPDVLEKQGTLELTIGETKIGEAISIPQPILTRNLWHFGCAFAQAELIRALFHLLEGDLYLPGSGVCADLSLCSLGKIATLGPDARDIHDGFTTSEGHTAFPAFWSHDADKVITIGQRPNKYLSPLSEPKPGRNLRKVGNLWPKAGSLLVAERLWLYTMHVAAVRLPTRVLSNTWWPMTLNKEDDEAEKALSLWLNSSLGLLLTFGHRQETRGAWIKFKKPVLKSMPVLDITTLSPNQRAALAAAFDELADSTVAPFREMAHDPTRAAIDEAIREALDLPDFSILRELLAREPIISGDLETLLSPRRT